MRYVAWPTSMKWHSKHRLQKKTKLKRNRPLRLYQVVYPSILISMHLLHPATRPLDNHLILVGVSTGEELGKMVFVVRIPHEDEEAARYMRCMDTYRDNSDDTDMDEDEEEDYLVMANDDDNEGDASDSAAGSSTPKDAGTRYELRTENSRHSPNRFTPSGWSTKGLKKGVSRLYKNVKDRVKKK
ncbi:hypothetical protein PIB30_064607 [Stylosanthes scabra]|uniref:Uncharacterized protein n=1 Tax=Stylosanthes scabra TaxID=79078 RepID=A0ABU6RMW5_9FABA|nr:hypothetical protein [Stylosanthes scabra]